MNGKEMIEGKETTRTAVLSNEYKSIRQPMREDEKAQFSRHKAQIYSQKRGKGSIFFVRLQIFA